MVLEDVNRSEQAVPQSAKGGEHFEPLKSSSGNQQRDEQRDPSDAGSMSSSGDDSSGYADFLTFLKSPSEKAATKKDVGPPSVVAVKKDAPAVSQKSNVSARKVLADVSKLPNEPSQRRGKMDKQPSAKITARESAAESERTVPAPAPVEKKATPAASDSAPPTQAAKQSSTEAAQTKPAVKQTSSTDVPKIAPVPPLKPKEVIEPTSTADSSVVASDVSTTHIRPDAPAAVEYFTKKAEEEKVKKMISARELSLQNMSVSARYFDKKTQQEQIEHNAMVAELIEAPRPAAIEYFTLKAMGEQERKKREIAEGADAPAAYAVQHFTDMDRKEKERKKKEIEELKENPPPPSVAGQHFDKINQQKKKEMEELLNQPQSAAAEHFNKIADGERRRQEAAKKTANDAPYEASTATQHFAKLDEEKARKREAAKSSTMKKAPVEPLPIDYFTKQNEKELEGQAKAQWELAESQISAGQAFFTAKGEEDKALALEQQQKLSEEHMSVATRHFARVESEKKANAKEEKVDQMPLAIQHFTLKDREIKDKRKAEIAALKENPPDMAPGQAYFTEKMREEQAKKAVEIKAMKENPPLASVAGQHFDKINQQKQKEIEEMMNQPASVATEHFNKKAEEEKRQRQRQQSSETPHEMSIATQHFANKSTRKAQEIKDARAKTQSENASMVPLPIDYYTKLGQTETEARAQEAKNLADANASAATKYFTNSATSDEAPKVSEENMSTATLHFSRRASKLDAEKKQNAEKQAEMMPAGIQYFTQKAYEERKEKQKALEKLKNSSHAMTPGQAHFTPELTK